MGINKVLQEKACLKKTGKTKREEKGQGEIQREHQKQVLKKTDEKIHEVKGLERKRCKNKVQ